MPDIDVNGPQGKHISSKQPDPQDKGLGQMVMMISPVKIVEAFCCLHTPDKSCGTHELQLTLFSIRPELWTPIGRDGRVTCMM